MSRNTRKSSPRRIRRIATRCILLISAFALILVTAINLLKIDLKVLDVQLTLGLISQQIDEYNRSDVKTDAYTQKIQEAQAERVALANDEDPIIAFAARNGFSIFLFTLALLPWAAIIGFPIFKLCSLCEKRKQKAEAQKLRNLERDGNVIYLKR